MRRLPVAHVKLDRLAFLCDISNDHRPCLLIGTDQIADQKVSSVETLSMLIYRNADMERPVGQYAFLTAK